MIVTHPTRTLYLVAALFPFVSVAACWCCFYGLGHNRPGKIVTISETVIGFPESRIFAVTMNIEALLILFIFLMRNKIVSLYAALRDLEIRKFTMRACSVIAPIGLVILSSVTLEDWKAFHLFGAFLFFAGSIIYDIVSDIALKAVGRTPPRLSRCLTWSAFVCSIFYVGIFIIAVNMRPSGTRRLLGSISALFQYATAACVFTKVFMYAYDAPRHYFTVQKSED